MLPDLRLTVALGEDLFYVTARDLPVALFFLNYPDPPERPGMSEEVRAQAHAIAGRKWAGRVLARAIVNDLTPAQLRRLVVAAEDTAQRYLVAVGWAPGCPEDERIYEPRWSAASSQDLAQASVAAPAPKVGRALKLLSEQLHVPPHVVWTTWSAGEFCFSWRILHGEAAVASSPTVDPFAHIPTHD